jgi:hypothetical protein
MRTVSSAIKEDGIVVIQTPCYQNEEIDPIILKDKGHLYLFNKRSLHWLLKEANIGYIREEPSLFHHDIFIVCGKSLPKKLPLKEVENSLLATPQGRILLSMLNLYTRYRGVVVPLESAKGKLGTMVKR